MNEAMRESEQKPTAAKDVSCELCRKTHSLRELNLVSKQTFRDQLVDGKPQIAHETHLIVCDVCMPGLVRELEAKR